MRVFSAASASPGATSWPDFTSNRWLCHSFFSSWGRVLNSLALTMYSIPAAAPRPVGVVDDALHHLRTDPGAVVVGHQLAARLAVVEVEPAQVGVDGAQRRLHRAAAWIRLPTTGALARKGRGRHQAQQDGKEKVFHDVLSRPRLSMAPRLTGPRPQECAEPGLRFHPAISAAPCILPRTARPPRLRRPSAG